MTERAVMLKDMAGQRSYKQKRPIAEGSPAAVYPNELAKGRKYIDVLRWHHVELSKRFLAVSNGDVYEIDLMLTGVMVRSYGLVDGFIDAFDNWNPIVAAPLLRMQLDNLVRLSYMVRAPSASDVARYLVLGGQFRNLKDSEGKLLTDSRLLHHAKEFHPWVRPVYEATSGWVHFSPEHVYAAVRLARDDDGEPTNTLQIEIPLRPERIPLSALEELLGAMTKATEEVFGYMEVWEQRKGPPLGQIRELGSD
jgi:hypothetical protein